MIPPNISYFMVYCIIAQNYKINKRIIISVYQVLLNRFFGVANYLDDAFLEFICLYILGLEPLPFLREIPDNHL